MNNNTDEHDQTVRAADDQGHVMNYSYAHNGRLSEVQENGRIRWPYLYDFNGMTTVQGASGRYVLLIQYSRGRIASLTKEGAGAYHFDYLLNQRGMVDETMVTDRAGKTSTFKF